MKPIMDTIFFTAISLSASIVCAASQRAYTFRPALQNQAVFSIYKNTLSVRETRSNMTLEISIDIAIKHLVDTYGIKAGSVSITDAYKDGATGISHIYACQLIDGMPVVNGLANVNVNAMGQVISSGQSFAKPVNSSQLILAGRNSALSHQPSDHVSDRDSLKSAIKALATYTDARVESKGLDSIVKSSAKGTYHIESGCSARRALIQNSSGQVVPVWHIVWQQPYHWWSAHVGTADSRIESLNDWVYGLGEEYKVLPWDTPSPAEGKPQTVLGPADKRASPAGWVSGNTTIGNNAWAQTNPAGDKDFEHKYRPMAAANMSQTVVFDFPLDLSMQPAAYADFSITQLFYTVNRMHDLAFLYGFDEAAGNFQDINFSGQGKGGDAVVAFAQDGSAVDNAQFMSPPDGQHGIMRMYLWNTTSPSRDGCLEQDIVAHEFTHGISNRLTGGPSNADCLHGGEAGGMGEGWSDAVANVLRIRPSHTRALNLAIGGYAHGSNIRTYPYSTSMQVNPLTYGMLNDAQFDEVHRIGEVWASILYEVMWSLMDSLGIASNLFARDLAKGNCLFLQIMLDAMKLQPCNPDFVQARDAILQAEDNIARAKNKCSLWRAFAKRGLGKDAFSDRSRRKEDFAVPKECRE